jgi:hypothetical protein
MRRLARKHRVRDAIARLAAVEREFLRAHFLAPVVRGGGVRVRIGGAVCRVRIDPTDFEGWGVFLPVSHAEAMLDREATMGERRRYLDLLPRVRLVVCGTDGGQPSAVPENRADARLSVGGQIDLRLAAEGEAGLFDTVVSRFDGSQFWFDDGEASADPGAAAYLRQSMAGMTHPDRLDRLGLTGGQREAYGVAYARLAEAARRTREQRRRDREGRDDQRMRQLLSHAGATLRDFAEGPGRTYRVTYDVDGRRHTSVVGRNDFTVLSAGICLSGEDAKFDLGSLVGVLREGAAF